jgi:hypothetical protein
MCWLTWEDEAQGERRLFFFFFDLKGTPSPEEQKTNFSGLKICKMALSNQIDSPAFFSLRTMTYRNFGIRQSAIAFPPKMALCRHVLENSLS